MKETDINKWATLMIEKIESIRKDWRKPWFTEEALQWPCNLSGREYNGMNAIMLLIHCEKEGYKIPRFCTFECVQRLNKSDKDNQEKPRVSVLRGEKVQKHEVSPPITEHHPYLIHKVRVMSRTETGEDGFTNMRSELVA